VNLLWTPHHLASLEPRYPHTTSLQHIIPFISTYLNTYSIFKHPPRDPLEPDRRPLSYRALSADTQSDSNLELKTTGLSTQQDERRTLSTGPASAAALWLPELV